MTLSVRLTRRRVVAAACLLALVGGTAWAVWSTTASGPQTRATIGSLSAITFGTFPSFPTSTLFPSSTSDGSIVVNNPGTSTLKLTAWTAGVVNGSGVTVTGASGSCTGSDIAGNVSAPAQTLATPVSIPPGTSNVTLPAFWSASAALPTTCQGGQVTVAATNSGWTTQPALTFTP